MIYAKFAIVFLCGFLLCVFIDNFIVEKQFYIPTVTSKTQIITQQTPTKIIYKDKTKEIKIECPSQSATLTNSHEMLMPEKKLTPKFSFGFYYNFHDVDLTVGYLMSNRLSLNVITSTKFDKIGIGATIFF